MRIKCCLFLILLIGIFTVFAFSGSRVLLYQGKVSDSGGVPINQNSVNVTVAIYDAATGGSQVAGFSETHLVNIENGLFTINIGSKTTDGIPSEVFETGDDIYLSITIASQEQLPRPKIAYVPYTLSSYGSSIDCADYAGTVDAGSFCIDQDWSDVVYYRFYDAQVACSARGMRLCYWQDYSTACVLWQNGEISLSNMLATSAGHVQHSAERSGITNRGFGHIYEEIYASCFDETAFVLVDAYSVYTYHYRCCISKR